MVRRSFLGALKNYLFQINKNGPFLLFFRSSGKQTLEFTAGLLFLPLVKEYAYR